MECPWLIQRCELDKENFTYDHMGSSEFELGKQAKSLMQIFEKGMTLGTATITVRGKTLTVYMIAADDFPFAEYQPYLQQLADDTLRLKEHTYFNSAAAVEAGAKLDLGYKAYTNVWFDFSNDVLWTLKESHRKNLIPILEAIKKKWAEKE